MAAAQGSTALGSSEEAEERELRRLERELKKRKLDLESRRVELELRKLEETAGRSSVVRLNIGGSYFDTSADTLRRCSFFDALLSGDYGAVAVDDGRVFVDRDGALFGHILAFLRERRRPPAEALRIHTQQLLAECAYYGFEDFAHELRGDTNPFDLRPADRQMLRDEEECMQIFQSEPENWEVRHWEDRLLLDVFAQSQGAFVREPPQCLELPLLFEMAPIECGDASVGPSLAVKNMSEFRLEFNRITGGLLDDITDPRGLIFAGGAVLAALTGTTCSDVDIFMAGLDATQARQQFDTVLSAVKKNKRRLRQGDESWAATHLVVSRTRLCVTIHRQDGDDDESRPVQIVLSLYRSPLEVILNFDVDACCVLYDLAAERVCCMPRSRRAINTRCNIADTKMRSPNYERRLEKYAARGYAVAVPGLREACVDASLFEAEYFADPDSGLLLRLGTPSPSAPVPRKEKSWGNRPWKSRVLRFKAKVERPAEAITGLQRLMILDRALQGPDVCPRLHRQAEFMEESLGRRAKHVTLFREAPLPPVVLASVQRADENNSGSSSEPEDSELDQSSPKSVLRHMLLLIRRSSRERLDEAAADEEVPRVVRASSNSSDGEVLRSLSSLRERFQQVIMRRLEAGKSLGAVYDVTSVNNAEHSDLGYITDAAKGRLSEIGSEDFLMRIGVTRLLEFQPCRERASSAYFGRQSKSLYHKQKGSWFAGVYAA